MLKRIWEEGKEKKWEPFTCSATWILPLLLHGHSSNLSHHYSGEIQIQLSQNLFFINSVFCRHCRAISTAFLQGNYVRFYKLVNIMLLELWNWHSVLPQICFPRLKSNKCYSSGSPSFSHFSPGHFPTLHHDGKESGENALFIIFFYICLGEGSCMGLLS